jgi:hypothetical protein
LNFFDAKHIFASKIVSFEKYFRCNAHTSFGIGKFCGEHMWCVQKIVIQQTGGVSLTLILLDMLS